MSGGVTIVGVGARTPVGLRADTSAAAVRAGVSRVMEHPYMVDRGGEPMRLAFDRALDPELRGAERLAALGRPALLEACESLPLALNPRVDVLLGLPEERPGWSATDSDALVATLLAGLPFEPGEVALFPRGHAASLLAMEFALERLQKGASDWCLVGGVDSYLHADTLEWLDANRQLKSKQNRSAFIPGEGAGFCLLTDPARAPELPPLADILSVASDMEAARIKTEAICVGDSLCRVIRSATSCLDPRRQKISRTYCDINGERYRTDEFFYVPLRVWTPFVDANTYEAPAGSWGDVGAASGALFAALAIASRARGYSPGKYVLLWASSEAGLRSAATLALPD